MGAPKGFKRLRLTRAIVLNGEHEDRDSVHDVPDNLAARLVGEGSAVHHVEPGEKPPTATSVNRMEAAQFREPKSQVVSRPNAKGAPASKGEKSDAGKGDEGDGK